MALIKARSQLGMAESKSCCALISESGNESEYKSIMTLPEHKGKLVLWVSLSQNSHICHHFQLPCISTGMI